MCALPGRSRAVERIADHRDASTALFPTIRINLAWYSATEEQISFIRSIEFIKISILTLIFSCWLPPGWTSCLSSSEALRRDSASQYTDCSSCCLLKNIYIYDHVRRFSLIWCTTTFFFSFTFYGYILRKLRKNDRHDVSIVIEEDEEDSEINGWRSRWRRSTRHSGKSREDRLIRRPLLRGSFETTIWQQLLALGHHARSNFLFVYLGLTFHV